MPKRGGTRKVAHNGPTGEKTHIATDLPISDRASKRVIAPFVRIVRKGLKPHEVEESKHFSLYLQKKPSVLIRDLSSFLSDTVDLPSLLHETADVLKMVTKAAGVTVYVMNPATNEIYQSRKTPLADRHKIKWKIREGTIVAAYVACRKNHVLADDILNDERFPEGIGYQNDQVRSVLCIPVVTPDNECFAVMELYKLLFENPFTKDDVEICLIVTGWMGAAIHQNSQRLALQRQQELNDYLLDLTKCYFGESVVMEKMILEIIKFARVTLNAERGSIFIIDRESGEDLLADLFEESGDETTAHKKPQRIRFAKDRGIASLVARSGVTINIRDAYKEAKFYKEMDQKSGFITRSVLCMPIMGVEGILGVVQVINKKTGGYFTRTDENLFRTFCVYGALALRFTKIQSQMNSTKHLNTIFVNMLRLQIKPCVHDISHYVHHNPRVEIPEGFDQFDWYINLEDHLKMPQFCLHMFLQIIDEEELDLDHTMQYILSIRKLYRKNPFHNFEHAFNVCHCMHLILKRNPTLFTTIEKTSLILAALSHDLDHPGLTNNFLEASKDDLAYLYEASHLENHHYDVAIYLLENFKIFHSLSKEDFDLMKKEMYHAIISTDLQVYFINKARLARILELKWFSWENDTHRKLLKGIMMTGCDLSGTSKPFLVSKRVTDNLYAEFYHQGDLEKGMGLCPLPRMDSEKTHLIPEDQVSFMNVIALPCFDILQRLMPNLENLYIQAKLILQIWQDIIDVRGKKCWRQDDSIVEKQYNY